MWNDVKKKIRVSITKSEKRNITKSSKKIIDKFYLATLYKHDDQVLLIKNEKYSHIEIAEQHINNLSIKHNIDVKGSFNPRKYGFTNKNFFDGMHGHDTVAKKIFE